MSALRRLLRDTRAASAAEFALVVPGLLIVLMAIVDGSRYIWNVNQLEKAAHFGVRYAVVTAPVASEITSHSFVDNGGSPAIYQGDVIPASLMATVTCDSTECSCEAGATGVCLSGTYNSTAFTNIVDRMKLFFPAITNDNVTVSYAGSGLGYAGDPSGADVAPIVTVTVHDLVWQPISALALVDATFPTLRDSLTAEDLTGAVSN